MTNPAKPCPRLCSPPRRTMLVVVAHAVAFLSVSAFPVPAFAHMKLVYPPADSPQDNQGMPLDIKDLGSEYGHNPCGGSELVTNTVTTLRPGTKIVVKWVEAWRHSGHYRISVARSVAEFMDPPITNNGATAIVQSGAPILMDGIHEHLVDDIQDFHEYTQEVTLPSFECAVCKLQLLQFMAMHTPESLMWHCADIVLSNSAPYDGGVVQIDPGGQDGAADGPFLADDRMVGAESNPVASDDGAAGSLIAVSGAGTAGSDGGGATRSTVTRDLTLAPGGSSDSGCSCSTAERERGFRTQTLAVIGAAVLCGAMARRRRRLSL